jgi:Tol biopolymer transport system component
MARTTTAIRHGRPTARVAFASDRAGSYDIWTVDVADGALRQITGGVREDRAPAWSADGKTIAFSGTQGTRNGIYSVPVQGGEATPLGIAPAGAHYDAPSLGGACCPMSRWTVRAAI